MTHELPPNVPHSRIARNAVHFEAPREDDLRTMLENPCINLVTFCTNDNRTSVEIAARQARLNRKFQFWFYNQDLDFLPAKLAAALPDLGLDDDNLNSALLDDVIAVARLLGNIGKTRSPFISLRTIGVEYFEKNQDSVSCCFHRDTTVLTAFRTYLGRGTEWVADDNVIRQIFDDHAIVGLGHPLVSFLHKPEEIFSTDVNTVGILKGEMNPDSMSQSTFDFVTNFISKEAIPKFNIGRGLIHRGPIIDPEELRLVLTVSSFTNF
jgi:hypothetical protein